MATALGIAYWRDVRQKALGKPKDLLDWAETLCGSACFLGLLWWAFGRDKALEELATTGVAVLSAFLVGAFFLILRVGRAVYEIHRDDLTAIARIEKERNAADEALADLKRRHARDVEWDRAIETFRGLMDKEISAHYTEFSDGRRTWRVQTGFDYYQRAIETACQQAGYALGLSKTGERLPDGIKNEQDLMARWLLFVAETEGFGGMHGSGHDTVNGVRISYESRSIRNVALSSKRLCELCRNSEAFLGGR